MEIQRAREDLTVAGAAAGMTVALAVGSRLGLLTDIGALATLLPVYVYFAYLFSRKGGPYGRWDTARNWAIAAIGVGLVALVAAGL